MSGGQKQRVALARALCHNPEVLLLDEPFTGLDSKSHDSIINFLKEHLVKKGITTIIVSHNDRTLELMGANVFTMK